MITGSTLLERGWKSGPLIGKLLTATRILEPEGLDETAILARLDDLRARPQNYVDDAPLGEIAAELLRQQRKDADRQATPLLHDSPLPYGVWGASGIDSAAIAQMDAAMRLPVTVAGALMPDAHVGYGLPIGGVLATEGSIIPYAVGVDIACRMRLSVYPESPASLRESPARFERALLERTYFGAGVSNPEKPDHPVLEDAAWKDTKLLRSLQSTAAKQIGTSGTGNHFVEWGILQISERDAELGLEPGEYLALLSHSGSRGVGFKIANTYSRLAMETRPTLDRDIRHLAWLSLESESGQEYLGAMELAGRFASANHWLIHHAVAESAGLVELSAVENHHNFAWEETVEDAAGVTRTTMVHRKGATPAGPGVLGVVPGSMGDPGFVVRGRGEPRALASASHGAGRAMSRRRAIESIPKAERDAYLAERGITLLGGGIDESPQAYKPIAAVLGAQRDLIDVLGRFTPRIVRMASEPGDI